MEYFHAKEVAVVFLLSVLASESRAAELSREDKRWRVSVSVDHSLSSGAFLQHEQLRATHRSVLQSWAFEVGRRFSCWRWQPRLMLGWAFDLELTTPNSNPARRWRPSDVRLSLSEPKLFQWSTVPLKIGTGLGLTLPTAVGSRSVKSLLFAIGGNLSAEMNWRALAFSYRFQGTKSFSEHSIARASHSVARDSDQPEWSGLRDEPATFLLGSANVDFVLSQTLGVAIEMGRVWSASYRVTILNEFRHAVADERDEWTAIHAKEGRGRRDWLQPTLEVAFDVKEAFDFSFETSIALGLTAFHPATTTDNQDVLWPVFFNVLGQNRAANNYGAAYLSLAVTV